MALIDIDKLLSEISPDQPCGPDLEYDPAFIALMEDAKGRPPKFTPDGQLVEEGEDPNWSEIRARCVEVFDRSIDLRVAMVLVNALLCDRGLAGLREGLTLLKGLLERYWDSFHPQLDPDDDNDPLERMNILSALAAPLGAEGDPYRFRQRLREIPLAESRQLGRFSLRDMLLASGDLPAPDGVDQQPTEQLITGAFQDTDGDLLKETARSADACLVLSKEIDQWITSKVGAGAACNLTPWEEMLAEICKRLKPRVEQRFPGETVADEPAPAPEAADQTRPTATGGIDVPPPLSGAIHSREDVIAALNKVLEYYARHEPSSPVPLLVRRAQKLVTMGFMDIIRELSPAALDQVRAIGGDEAPPQEPGEPAPPRKTEPPPPPKPAAPASSEPVRLGAEFTPR